MYFLSKMVYCSGSSLELLSAYIVFAVCHVLKRFKINFFYIYKTGHGLLKCQKLNILNVWVKFHIIPEMTSQTISSKIRN